MTLTTLTSPPLYKVGTVALNQGSDTITGTGTAWLNQVLRYGLFTVPGQAGIFYVDEVLSDTSIRLDRAWPYTGQAAASYIIFSQHGSITDAILHNAIAAALDRAEKSLAVHVFQEHELDESDEPLDTVGNDLDTGFVVDSNNGLVSQWTKLNGGWTNETALKGAPGSSLLSGNEQPDSGDGVDGDFWLDKSALMLYGPKNGGIWPAGLSIRGTDGTDGYTILSGPGAPDDLLGNDGDFYIDSTTNQTVYGPKAGGSWPAGKSIKGDKGDPFEIDAIDVLANRSNYDSEADGFIFYASDEEAAYQRDSGEPSGWKGPIAFGGATGAVNQNTIQGRVTAGSGSVEELTPAQVRALLNVEEGATGDQSGAEIKAAYEGEANTNPYTDAEKAKVGNMRGKNAIINGSFQIWQRGTSQTSSGYGSDDRWYNIHNGSTKTHSQQEFTLGQSDVPGNPRYFSRTVVTSSAGASNYVIKQQRIEYVRTLSGLTATVSFYAKADASKDIAVSLVQNYGTSGSPSTDVNISPQKVSLTTSWQKFTLQFSIPSIIGKTLGTDENDYLALVFWFDAGSDYNTLTDTLGQQSGTFDIALVQIEKGNVATDFEQCTEVEEKGLCYRYLRPITHVIGHANSTLAVNATIEHIGMRGVPVITAAAALDFTDGYAADKSQSSFSTSVASTSKDSTYLNFNNFSDLTIGRIYYKLASSPPVYADAEL